MGKNCYNCRHCAYKPWEYGVTGRCAADRTDEPFLPLTMRYAEAGSFWSFAENCPDYKEGERQKLCKQIYDKRAEIAGLLEEVEMMVEEVIEFDYEIRDYFGDTHPRWYNPLDDEPIPEIKPTENPNRVWKAMKDVGFETRGTH